MKLHATVIESIAGPIGVATDADGTLVRLNFLGIHGYDSSTQRSGFKRELHARFSQPVIFEDGTESDPSANARTQLEQYFDRERRTFHLPLRLQGTPFQRRVWEALLKIPFGKTMGYGELAKSIGAPGAARAVGGANHVNPIAIVVPCHRVVGAGGQLTGFGGGLVAKRALLDLENPQAAFADSLVGG